MARYGDEFYGLSLYGAETLVDFDVSPFTARSIDYNKILVLWATPTGDWDQIKLVRNGFGFPVTPDDGDLLFAGTPSSDGQSYLDQGQVPNNSGLIEGRTYYYTMFIRESTTLKWNNAGITLGIAVKNYGTADLLYEYLPAVYKIGNPYSAQDNSPQESSDLYNFLQVFAFEYDLFKTLTENIKNRYNPLTLDGRLVPALLNQFGFPYEAEIGLQQARILLKNAIKIYSERGSLSGIKTFTSAFTGYNSDISPIKNLMLDYNNATFRETIGFWEATTNCTLTRGTGSTESPAVAPYEEPNSPSNFPNFQTGFLKVTASALGDTAFKCGSLFPLTRGVPVTAGTSYALTAYVRAKTTARTVVANIEWYSRFGVKIAEAGESYTTNTVGSWTRTVEASGTAPENAYFAVPVFRVEDCAAGEIHYLDAVQLEVGSEATTFTDARRIDVILRANRINQVTNPSFENNLSNWTVTGAATSERVATGALYRSNYSAKVTLGATIATALNDAIIPVTASDQHALSAYVKGSENAAALLLIRWYDQSMQLVNQYTSPSVVFDASGDWERITTERLAPPNASFAQVGVVCSPSESGDEVYVDAVLFEKSAFVAKYFDGNAGYDELSDLVWEAGDPDNGRSHYYKNRDVVVKRLLSTLVDYLPNGSPWAVFVAQPD